MNSSEEYCWQASQTSFGSAVTEDSDDSFTLHKRNRVLTTTINKLKDTFNILNDETLHLIEESIYILKNECNTEKLPRKNKLKKRESVLQKVVILLTEGVKKMKETFMYHRNAITKLCDNVDIHSINSTECMNDLKTHCNPLNPEHGGDKSEKKNTQVKIADSKHDKSDILPLDYQFLNEWIQNMPQIDKTERNLAMNLAPLGYFVPERKQVVEAKPLFSEDITVRLLTNQLVAHLSFKTVLNYDKKHISEQLTYERRQAEPETEKTSISLSNSGEFKSSLICPASDILDLLHKYATASPENDKKVQWKLFTITELEHIDNHLVQLYKQELEIVERKKERYRSALLLEMDRRNEQILRDTHIFKQDGYQNRTQSVPSRNNTHHTGGIKTPNRLKDNDVTRKRVFQLDKPSLILTGRRMYKYIYAYEQRNPIWC